MSGCIREWEGSVVADQMSVHRYAIEVMRETLTWMAPKMIGNWLLGQKPSLIFHPLSGEDGQHRDSIRASLLLSYYEFSLQRKINSTFPLIQ